jgi:hypothetical protein
MHNMWSEQTNVAHIGLFVLPKYIVTPLFKQCPVSGKGSTNKRAYVKDAHLLELQRVENRLFRTIGKFDRHTRLREMHMALNIPYVYYYYY